jgi:hypothetical protein
LTHTFCRYIDDGKYSRRPSFPDLGRPGIHKDCFIFRDQDLVSAAGPSGMKNVFEYIMDRFVGRSASTYAYAGSEASLLAKGIELNDFFAEGYNSAQQGLLLAEFVPPAFTGLPQRMPDFSEVTDSVTAQSPSFFQDSSQVACVKLDNIRDRLPQCHPNKDDPVDLEESHCEDASMKVYEEIEEYANRIESIPVRSTERRWPDPPKYCVWDCGSSWDGHSAPVHTGLNNESKADMHRMLDRWKGECIAHAAERKYCITKRDVGSIRNSIQQAKRADYYQEVCGQYIDESLKFLKDHGFILDIALVLLNLLPGVGTAVGLAISTAVKVGIRIGTSAAKLAKQGAKMIEGQLDYPNSGINATFESIFTDETARHVTDREYRCEKILVRSTGSSVVDRVRESLSYNDIEVSKKSELLSQQGNARIKAFNDKLFNLIAAESLNIYDPQSTCKNPTDACINSIRRNGDLPRSRKVDPSFFQGGDKQGCLTLGVVKGRIDCKFWLRDGLGADIATVKPLAGQTIRSAARRKMASWTVFADEMPDESLETTTSYAEVSVQTRCTSRKTQTFYADKMHLKKNPDLFCRQDAPQENPDLFCRQDSPQEKPRPFLHCFIR